VGRSSADFRFPLAQRALTRIGFLALVLVIAFIVAHELGWLDYRDALAHVARLRRSYSFPVFATVFVVASGFGMALGFPGMPFVVAAGALFGTLLGSILGWLASMVGAVLGYWIARGVGHDVVRRWVKRFPRVEAAVSETSDFDGMLRLRLLPVLPIGVVNFIGGLARAPMLEYLFAAALGTIPATFIYAYFADSFLERVGKGRQDALRSLIVASVLLAALSLLPSFVRWRKRRGESRARQKPGVASQPHPSRRP
jgi:uncharacterized membrane protein YdjX (TVP38/TMEM64 family)